MKQERALLIEGRKYTLLISDEPQALLEAKASGRAVLGCLDTGNGEGASRDFQGIPYVVPSMEYVTEELLELILRRYFYNQTQMETAKALGVSQVQVSRLEKKCLKELRKRFEG